MNLTHFSLRNPLVVAGLAVALCLFGVFAYSTPEVPPTAHQTLIHSVVTIPAMTSSTSNAMTCNMGK